MRMPSLQPAVGRTGKLSFWERWDSAVSDGLKLERAADAAGKWGHRRSSTGIPQVHTVDMPQSFNLQLLAERQSVGRGWPQKMGVTRSSRGAARHI